MVLRFEEKIALGEYIKLWMHMTNGKYGKTLEEAYKDWLKYEA
jgi:hypothetical protein